MVNRSPARGLDAVSHSRSTARRVMVPQGVMGGAMAYR